MKENTIQRALISVSNKEGIIEFARELQRYNIEIIATGGTATFLKKNCIKIIEVADYTEHPQIMGGRVKTLHPKIHGGILARRGIDDRVMRKNNIKAIDLVVVNLYPFADVIANTASSYQTAIENIDIGGPAMLRSSAKNHQFVSVVVDSNDYQLVLAEIKAQGNTNLATRKYLATKTFEHTAKYDGMIASYLGNNTDGFSNTINLQLTKKQLMRYGENPHQKAALYTVNKGGIANARQLHGKTMGFNNFIDSDAAVNCLKEFEEPSCVIVKHANPCGVACSDNIYNAYHLAYNTDPTSAFGGVIAVNRALDEKTANAIINKQFVEVIIAPKIDDNALNIIKNKKNIRVLSSDDLFTCSNDYNYKSIQGGMLVQEQDNSLTNNITVVTKKSPSSKEMADLIFAFKVAKSVKSNAIVYAKNNTTLGIGAGQMSRVYSTKIAGIKANCEGLNLTGSVMASDAFLPFKDSVEEAAKIGISAIIQPGGSIRDDEVIQTANEHCIAMIFTGMRHFYH